MILGLLAMGPAAVFGEKKNKPREIFLISIILFIAAFVLMGYATSPLLFIVGVVSFFIGFNMMEPLVQSMISKFAKVHQKGAALGISNSVAYFMTFIGGTAAGLALDISDRQTLGQILAVVGIIWLIWTFRLANPERYAHLFIPVADVDQDKLNALEHDHIAEWYINETEGVVAVKYKKEKIDEEVLKAQIVH
jgi:MFS family permease